MGDFDFDIEDYNTGSNFVRKEDLTGEPQRVRIARVEERDGLKKDADGKVLPELVLIFSDERKFGLRTKANRDALRDAFGRRTSGWIGKAIELYVDPEVRNPSGGKVGGIRVRIPVSGGNPVGFTSELEEDAPEPLKPAKGRSEGRRR